MTALPTSPKKKGNPPLSPMETIAEVYHLHRRQVVLHAIEDAINRLAYSKGALAEIPKTRYFMDSLQEAEEHLESCVLALRRTQNALDESIRRHDVQIAKAIGWEPGPLAKE